mgnify:CR=1 FL=1
MARDRLGVLTPAFASHHGLSGGGELVGQHGSQEFNVEKLLNERPEYFVFNGSVGALSTFHPLQAKVGETVRIFFGVGGPNFTSSFHVIGEIFDKVYNLGGATSEPLKGIQTVTVPAGGAVITEAGDLPNVAGLVYIAAFAPDAGESPGGITAGLPPAAIANVAPDSDGYLWIKPDKFHESFCQDLPEDQAFVMAVTQKAPLGSTFGDAITSSRSASNWRTARVTSRNTS